MMIGHTSCDRNRIINSFIDRHCDKIAGTIGCFDRVVITGTIPGICYSQGMTDYLRYRGIRIFDFKKWAEPLRERVRENAKTLATNNSLEIIHVRSSRMRKESIVQRVLAERGDEPGMVAILSAMEGCPTFDPWHDKKTHKTYLRHREAKCLHYYFYFIDEEFGLCYLRVPTWAPFRLQFYFNGHNWLASRLRQAGVEFETLDNAFVHIADDRKAQALADDFSVELLHEALDRLAHDLCPVVADFRQGVYWSLMQVEYATDVIFKRQRDLEPIYEEIMRTAIHSVKPENIATFLGRKLHGAYRDEMGNNFNTRIEGTRIRHHMGKVAIKMYDKYHLVLRVETTANDVRFFKHYREVEHRDGTRGKQFAPMKKHIYSLGALREVMTASNNRYLEFVAAIDDPSVSLKELDRVSRTAREKKRGFRGFNFFNGEDVALLRTILDGGFCLGGLRHSDLRERFPDKSSGQLSYLLKRLRKHGLIKKVGGTYKYYVTSLGRRVGLMGLRLKEMYIIPALRGLIEQPA